MALVGIEEVQSWLTETRLLLSHDDDLDEEANVSELVRSRLAHTFDVTTWTTIATTPTLVRKVIAAKVAALRYQKHYADQADELPFADKIMEWADTTLEGIAEGKLKLLDVVTDDEVTEAETARSIAFKPDDNTAIEDEDDDRKFTIGQLF